MIIELDSFLYEVKKFKSLLKDTSSLPGSIKNIEEQLNSFIKWLKNKKDTLIVKKECQFFEKQKIDHFMECVELEKIGEIQFTYKRCIEKLMLAYFVLNFLFL